MRTMSRPPQRVGGMQMDESFYRRIAAELSSIEAAGLFKRERVLTGAQGAQIRARAAGAGRELLNFCANNYLGLAADSRVVEAAAAAMRQWGFGLSSVRFICGTQEPHVQLEQEIAAFLGKEAAVLYVAAFDANGGLFEPLLGQEDAIISDALNHASIIDGVRLCKAQRLRYAHADMADLERLLRETAGARTRLVVTDGVFSMDGDLAPLPEIVALAKRYDALVAVDDSHATGFMGPAGRGTGDHYGLQEQIDIITTTFGKALGGASGGCVAARRDVVALLRQRSRPYLFSNSVAPAIVAGTRAALEIAMNESELRVRLHENAARLRSGLRAVGFDVAIGRTPIIPVMLYDETVAVDFAARLFDHGIYAVAFSYPVVPKGTARIRLQASAAHSPEQIDRAIEVFQQVAAAMGLDVPRASG